MKLVALVLVAAACGGSSPPPAQPQQQPPPATPSRPMTQPDPTPVPQPVATFAMPASCLAYHQAVMDLMKCDKMAASRDAMKQGLDAMERGLAQMAEMPEESRAAAMDAASTGCQAGVDAIKQAVAAMGC